MNKAKITKVAETIAFALIILFGLVGAIVLSIVFHEYSHANDFKDVADNAQICGLVLPAKASDIVNSEGGYYIFSYQNDSETSNKVSEIKEYTEYKAYSVTFSVLLVFTVCLVVIFRKFLSELIDVRKAKYNSSIAIESLESANLTLNKFN